MPNFPRQRRHPGTSPHGDQTAHSCVSFPFETVRLCRKFENHESANPLDDEFKYPIPEEGVCVESGINSANCMLSTGFQISCRERNWMFILFCDWMTFRKSDQVRTNSVTPPLSVTPPPGFGSSAGSDPRNPEIWPKIAFSKGKTRRRPEKNGVFWLLSRAKR